MVHESFQVTSTHEAILDYPDLFGIIFHGDDVQGFDTRWDEVVSSIRKVLPDGILESLVKNPHT